MKNFIQSVDERTKLAGANRMEVLLFSLGEDATTGRHEVYGINVFKVREVMHVPDITRAPDMPPTVEGMISLRGVMIPVINLPRFCSIDVSLPPKILIVTEYNKHMQGFLVHSVETIERLAWADVREPPQMLTNQKGGLVTAVTELSDDRVVMIMDVERVLAETAGFETEDSDLEGVESIGDSTLTVLYADDSSVARKQVKMTLEKMGAVGLATNNGAEAWERLEQLAEQASAESKKVSDLINIILTDVEMPEM